MKHRNLFNTFLFTVFTFGIYYIYWMLTMPSEFATALDEKRPVFLDALLILVTCGLYGVYLSWKSADYVNRIAAQRGEKTEDMTTLALVLFLCGGGIVTQFLLQDKMNGFVENNG